MIKIVNNIIPLKGFLAICLWPFLFIRKENLKHFSWYDENHENIHAYQQQEMFIVGDVLALILAFGGFQWWSLITLPLFYWWYLAEWIVKCVIYRNPMTAYKNVSFEREAYNNQSDMTYIDGRKMFNWLNFI